jgi:hypothetical protein
MSTFKQFTEDDIVRANPTEVTMGIWSGDTGSLTAFYSSSAQASGSLSGQYYWDVYNINPSASTAEVQFSLAYGHRTGGGNQSLAVSNTATLSTMATYAQYRNLLLEPGDTKFTFDGNVDKDHIYVINIARSRLKEKLDPGNWLLTLAGASGSFTFIDDSGQTLGTDYGRAGAVFNVCQGTLSGSTGATITASRSLAGEGFGLVYPSLGIIVLNPDAIAKTVGLVSGSVTVSGSTFFAANTGSNNIEYNHAGLFHSIRVGANFTARSAETISSTHYVVDLRPKEFNYSNNPTFYNSSNGALITTDFINNPKVYVTTVGFYDDSNELVAVAKLSKPVQKDFTKAFTIRARLDW